MKEDEQEGTASVSEASADQKTQEPQRRPVNPDMTARVSVLVCVCVSVCVIECACCGSAPSACGSLSPVAGSSPAAL